MATIEFRSKLSASGSAVFSFHERDDALQQLLPAWERVRVIERSGGIEDGAKVVMEARVGLVWLRWTAVHERFVAGEEFTDRSFEGPFKRWVHRHHVEPAGLGTCWLTDTIDYELPLGRLGALVGDRFVRARLTRMFFFRHRTTARLCGGHVVEGFAR